MNWPIVTDYEDWDADGLRGWEEPRFLTNPFDGDTDDDGLGDGAEVHYWGTDPLRADTDADGLTDKQETDRNLDALRNDAAEDPDGDGRTNAQEVAMSSPPFDYYNSEPPILIVSGNNQQGFQNTILEPLIVEVRKRLVGQPYGDPLINAPVEFQNVAGGTFSATREGTGASNSIVVRTGADGRASAFHRLPGIAGKKFSPTVKAGVTRPKSSPSRPCRRSRHLLSPCWAARPG